MALALAAALDLVCWPPKFWRSESEPKLTWRLPAAATAVVVVVAWALTTVTPEGRDTPEGMETPEGREMVMAWAEPKETAKRATMLVNCMLAVGWGGWVVGGLVCFLGGVGERAVVERKSGWKSCSVEVRKCVKTVMMMRKES